jgi:hypothetical protein
MMNTTASFAARVAAFHAANAAKAANTKYADYRVYRTEGNRHVLTVEVSFPNDVRNANFGDVCFYDAATDTFRDSTEVDVAGTTFYVERVA